MAKGSASSPATGGGGIGGAMSLSKIITDHFDRHQRSRAATARDGGTSSGGTDDAEETEQRLIATEATAGRIRDDVAAFVLNRAVANVTIDGGNDGVDDDDDGDDDDAMDLARKEVITATLRCLDGALATVHMATDMKKKKKKGGSRTSSSSANAEESSAEIVGEWSESVHAILQLVAALGCGGRGADGDADAAAAAAANISSANALLDRAAILSDVASDGVRAYVCTFVGLCVDQLLRSTAANTVEEEDEGEEWRMEFIDKAGTILLPRLTDKAQSVRASAIRACSSFFTQNSSDLADTHERLTDALLNRMAHDSSFANRCAAIQSVPVTEDTVPYLLERVGDVKEKVRVEALEALMDRVDIIDDMNEEQRVDVLRFGLTSRCASTHDATAAMLCGGWMKTLKFDPIGLLRLLDPVNNESVCDSAMRTIIGAATNADMLQASLGHLSPPEVRAYKESVLEPIKVERREDEEALDPATAFYLRVVCESTMDSSAMSASERNEILGNFMPDVPALCEIVQKHLGRLVGSIRDNNNTDDVDDEDQDDAAVEFEEGEAFTCLQLLQLIKCADLQEEGSRRHLVSILYGMLCSQETPDDLIEACVRTMALAHDSENQFLQTISEVVAEIKDEEAAGANDAAESNEQMALRQIRVLSILSVVLEQVSGNASSIGLLDTFSDSIVAAVTSNNNLVREAGVSCLGKYALLTPESKVVNDFKPLLLQVASSKKEKIEVRAQALLALCDLALLFDSVLGSNSASTDSSEETNDISFVFLLSEMLCHSNSAVVIVAAEVAAKLLFASKLIGHPSMVAHLVVIFFDKDLLESSDADNDGDPMTVTEIGNPIRLQQILSLFFPAFSIKSEEGRRMLINSIKPLLSIVNDKLAKKKKGRKATAWPIAKMVEYVCSNVDLGEQEAAKKTEATTSSEEEKNDEVNELSPIKAVEGTEDEEAQVKPSSTLTASIAIAEFLSESSVSCTTAYLRAICKIVGGADIILEEEPYESLFALKKSMDEAAMVVTDNSAIRSLETLLELLDEVEDKDDLVESDVSSDMNSLNEELERTNLSDADADNADPTADEEDEGENDTDVMEEGKPANNTSVEVERRQLGQLNVE